LGRKVEDHCKFAACSQPASGLDISSVSFDQRLYQSEAQSSSSGGLGAHGVHAVKPIKNAGQIFGGNSHAAVRQDQFCFMRIAFGFEQVVLGGIEFLREIRQEICGDGREQRQARRLAAERPGLDVVIGCAESVKGEKWEEFKDRHGDSGRDLVLYLGRKVCGLKLAELAEAVGLKDYAVVAMGIRRYEAKANRPGKDRKELKQIAIMLNIKM
jgi:hypothetical protein